MAQIALVHTIPCASKVTGVLEVGDGVDTVPGGASTFQLVVVPPGLVSGFAQGPWISLQSNTTWKHCRSINGYKK